MVYNAKYIHKQPPHTTAKTCWCFFSHIHENFALHLLVQFGDCFPRGISAKDGAKHSHPAGKDIPTAPPGPIYRRAHRDAVHQPSHRAHRRCLSDSRHIVLSAGKPWYEFQLKPLSHTNQKGWLNLTAQNNRTTLELFPPAVAVSTGAAYSFVRLLLATPEPPAMRGLGSSV